MSTTDWALNRLSRGDLLPCLDCLEVHVPRKLPNSGNLAPQWTAEDGHSFRQMSTRTFARMVLDGDLTIDNVRAAVGEPIPATPEHSTACSMHAAIRVGSGPADCICGLNPLLGQSGDNA